MDKEELQRAEEALAQLGTTEAVKGPFDKYVRGEEVYNRFRDYYKIFFTSLYTRNIEEYMEIGRAIDKFRKMKDPSEIGRNAGLVYGMLRRCLARANEF